VNQAGIDDRHPHFITKRQPVRICHCVNLDIDVRLRYYPNLIGDPDCSCFTCPDDLCFTGGCEGGGGSCFDGGCNCINGGCNPCLPAPVTAPPGCFCVPPFYNCPTGARYFDAYCRCPVCPK
jgi:hypothetical protein